MNQFLQLAKDILKDSEIPLVYQDIWKLSVEKSLSNRIHSEGKTPWQTLGARLFVEVRDNPNSEFVKIGKRPAKFYLKEKLSKLPKDYIDNIDREEVKVTKTDGTKYKERQLHPLLCYYAYTNSQFNRGRAVLTKTIYHEKSLKNGLNEWVHPDMVGVYIPIEDWNNEIIELTGS